MFFFLRIICDVCTVFNLYKISEERHLKLDIKIYFFYSMFAVPELSFFLSFFLLIFKFIFSIHFFLLFSTTDQKKKREIKIGMLKFFIVLFTLVYFWGKFYGLTNYGLLILCRHRY